MSLSPSGTSSERILDQQRRTHSKSEHFNGKVEGTEDCRRAEKFHEFKTAVNDFLLSPKEELEIEQLVKILEPMKSVTIALQRSDMDMDSARTLFDELLKTVENFDRNKKYIHKNCAIAKNNSFENSIVKLQSGDECALNVNENLACKKLRRTSDIECEFPQTDDFAGNVLAKKKKDTKQMKYIPCSFILPTSNHLERFFSAAGFASNDYRKSTLPMNLEEQLCLRFNKKHWDLNLVNQIVSASEWDIHLSVHAAEWAVL